MSYFHRLSNSEVLLYLPSILESVRRITDLIDKREKPQTAFDSIGEIPPELYDHLRTSLQTAIDAEIAKSDNSAINFDILREIIITSCDNLGIPISLNQSTGVPKHQGSLKNDHPQSINGITMLNTETGENKKYKECKFKLLVVHPNDSEEFVYNKDEGEGNTGVFLFIKIENLSYYIRTGLIEE